MEFDGNYKWEPDKIVSEPYEVKYGGIEKIYIPFSECQCENTTMEKHNFYCNNQIAGRKIDEL